MTQWSVNRIEPMTIPASGDDWFEVGIRTSDTRIFSPLSNNK